MQEQITMACTECKERNYITKKDKRKHADRLELKKFCPKCRTHKPHRESRVGFFVRGLKPADH